MSTVRKLHSDAMDFAEASVLARRNGQGDKAGALIRQAYEAERQAATVLASESSPEPTRSVIHRSAASLAIECGELREAERLISSALSGHPPDEIAEELRDLMEQVNFGRHLRVNGISLAPDEFQFSLSGSAIGYGIAQGDKLIDRLSNIRRLILRTIDRKAKRPYQDRVKAGKSKGFSVYLSAPRAASFAISVKVGQPAQLPLDGIESGPSIVDEIMSCMDLLNRGEDSTLREVIADDAYYRNFVGLARGLAPDGRDVTMIGFTAIRNGIERTVAVTRRQSEISPRSVKEEPSTSTEAARVSVQGELRYADSRPGSPLEIILVDQNKVEHTIVVPKGMMADIVRPLYEDEVVVSGTMVGRKIRLEDIAKAE